LLSHFNIPSFYCKVFAGKTPYNINREFPSQQFNHVILCVPNGNDTIWLENTSSYLPFDYLGSFTQNRYALLVDGEKSRLVKTPKVELENSISLETYTYLFSSVKNTQITAKLILKGTDFENIKFLLDENDEIGIKKFLSKKLSKLKSQLISWNIDDYDRDQNFISLTATLESKKLIRSVSDIKLISIPPTKIPKMENLADRKVDINIHYPIQHSAVHEFRFGEFLDKNSGLVIPDNIKIESDYGKYTIDYKQNKDIIEIKQSFILFTGRYSLSHYTSFYDFINKIERLNKTSKIVIKEQP